MSTTTFAPAVRYGSRSRAPRRPQVRLTRRGRLVIVALGLLVAFALGVILAAGSTATDSKGAPRVEVVTVQPGDTLWAIASDAAELTGSGDVRSMMDRIRDMNALDSSLVYAGQDLRVPTD